MSVVKFFKKNVPKFVCSMVKFSMPAIGFCISQVKICILGPHILLRYFDKTPKICCYGLIASYFIPKKCLV